MPSGFGRDELLVDRLITRREFVPSYLVSENFGRPLQSMNWLNSMRVKSLMPRRLPLSQSIHRAQPASQQLSHSPQRTSQLHRRRRLQRGQPGHASAFCALAMRLKVSECESRVCMACRQPLSQPLHRAQPASQQLPSRLPKQALRTRWLRRRRQLRNRQRLPSGRLQKRSAPWQMRQIAAWASSRRSPITPGRSAQPPSRGAILS